MFRKPNTRHHFFWYSQRQFSFLLTAFGLLGRRQSFRCDVSCLMLAGCRRRNFIPRIQVLQQLYGCCLTSGTWDRHTWCHRLSGIEFWLYTVIWCITYLLWRALSFSDCLVLLILCSLLQRSLSPAHPFFAWRLTRHECLLVCLMFLHVLGWVI